MQVTADRGRLCDKHSSGALRRGVPQPPCVTAHSRDVHPPPAARRCGCRPWGWSWARGAAAAASPRSCWTAPSTPCRPASTSRWRCEPGSRLLLSPRKLWRDEAQGGSCWRLATGSVFSGAEGRQAVWVWTAAQPKPAVQSESRALGLNHCVADRAAMQHHQRAAQC